MKRSPSHDWLEAQWICHPSVHQAGERSTQRHDFEVIEENVYRIHTERCAILTNPDGDKRDTSIKFQSPPVLLYIGKIWRNLVNILEIRKAIRANLRLKQTGLEPGSDEEIQIVKRLARKADEAMKAAQRDQPKLTRAEAWDTVKQMFLTAPEAPLLDTE